MTPERISELISRGEGIEIAGQGRVRLEISAEHLSRLLASRQLCAADFHCLDGESRGCVRALCQKNCSRYLAGLAPEAGMRNVEKERRCTPNDRSRKGRKVNRQVCDGSRGDCRKVSDGVYLTPFFLHKQALEESG